MDMNEPELEIIYVRVFLKLSCGLQLPSANVRSSGRPGHGWGGGGGVVTAYF